MRLYFDLIRVSGAFCLVYALLIVCPVASAQQNSNSSPSSPAVSGQEIQNLVDSVRALTTEMAALKSELSDVRAAQKSAAAEAENLRRQLSTAQQKLAALSPAAPASSLAYSPAPDSYPTASIMQSSPAPMPPATPERGDVSARIDRLAENQQLLEDKINDQHQTKVESGSKYPVRLSGIVLLNLFGNRGNVDNQDFPGVAESPDLLSSKGTFGGSLRQSQIGLEAFGPKIAGARTSADIRFDFAGGFTDAPNGATMGHVRLRTGTIRFDWANTSIVAGQDTLFFAPLAASSLAQIAVPPLSYAGKLWAWVPQLRVEHHVNFSENSSVLLQAAVLDSVSGDIPDEESENYPSWGEQSGYPAVAARVAWTHKSFGQSWTLGTGGFYGRQDWGFGRKVDGWAFTTDLSVPLGQFFTSSSEFYRGRAVGGLGGGIGQSILFSSPSLANPATSVHGLDSMGGWSQLKFKPAPKWEVNGAFGIDNPFASELRKYPASTGYYEDKIGRNFAWFTNFIYQPRSDVLFSTEFRRIRTGVLDGEVNTANHINFSVGYLF